MVTVILWGNDEYGFWTKRVVCFRTEISDVLNSCSWEDYDIED